MPNSTLNNKTKGVFSKLSPEQLKIKNAEAVQKNEILKVIVKNPLNLILVGIIVTGS